MCLTPKKPQIRVFLKRDMLKIEKKGPCQADPRCRRGIGFTKIPKTTLLHQIGFPNSHSPKIWRPKILPPNCLTHYLSTISIFPSRKIDFMRICQKIQKSGFNYSLFSPKNTKRRFFWKGACFFEKKRAPARQTPGVVAELVLPKNRQICWYNRSIWHFTSPPWMPPTRSTQWKPQNLFFNWKIFVFIGNGSKTI